MKRLLPLLLLAPLAAGCGTDDASGGDAATAANCPEPCVRMNDLKYEPAALTVRVGQTVTWVNTDTVVHDVVNAQEGEEPASPLFGEGRTYAFTAREPGTIRYVCTVHPGMEGSLTVQR